MNSDLSQIPKHPSHPEVPRPGDDELVDLARGVCHAIEACGASPELTHAVTLASDLVAYLQKPLIASTNHFGGVQGEELASRNAISAPLDTPVHEATMLGHCAASAADAMASLHGSHGECEEAEKSLATLVQKLSARACRILDSDIQSAPPAAQE